MAINTQSLYVKDMVCNSCEKIIEKKVEKLNVSQILKQVLKLQQLQLVMTQIYVLT